MRFTKSRAVVMGAAVLLALMPAGLAWGQEEPRPVGDSRVFASVPDPGHPGGILVDGDTVYVNTFNPVFRALDGYDAIFAYDRNTGALLTDRPNPIKIQRRVPATIMGFAGMEMDAEGRLNVADMTGRVIRVDPTTGRQEDYASFVNDSRTSLTGMPSDLAFDDSGNLYVTDGSVPVIWRVPPGGGRAEPFLVDPLIPGPWAYGIVCLALDPAGEYIYFTVNYGNTAAVYRVPLARPEPSAVELVRLYEPVALGSGGSPALFGAGDLAFGASGRLYVVLMGAGQISILLPDGTEEARFPSAEQNAAQEIPYDDPTLLALDGNGSLLVANGAFTAPANSVVFDAWVNDTPRPLERPSIGASGVGDGQIRAAAPVAVLPRARPALYCSLSPPRSPLAF